MTVAPFDVRQSGFTGGAVNAVTKSGTNTVQGSFYSYINNQDMIGSTPGPLEDGQTRHKYDTQFSQIYGFTVGAPVIRNRLFIFANAEFKRNTTPNVYTPANGSYDGIGLLENVIYNGQDLGNRFNSTIAEAMIRHYEENYGISGTGESGRRDTGQSPGSRTISTFRSHRTSITTGRTAAGYSSWSIS